MKSFRLITLICSCFLLLQTNHAFAQSFSLSASTNEASGSVQVTLSWTQLPKSSGETISYEVFRNGNSIQTTSSSGYVDQSAADGVLYSYCVEATKTKGTDTIYIRRACAKGFSYTTNNLMSASQGESDGYIKIKWKIPYNCALQANGKAAFVKLIDKSDNKTIYTKRIDSFTLAPFYHDEFIHWLDSGTTKDYELKMYRVGFGQEICSGLYAASGYTKPFVWPSIISRSSTPYSTSLSWTNGSDLISTYRVYRNDTLIEELDSSALHYINLIESNGSNSGVSYNYCIKLYNKRLNKVYERQNALCGNMQFVPVDFEVSTNKHPSKVEVTWKDLRHFCDEIKIYRDNKFLAKLPASSTAYFDRNPVYGKTHQYSLRLYENNEAQFELAKYGGVKANGSVEGIVTYFKDDIAIANASLRLVYSGVGENKEYITTSDETGAFEFNEVYYGTGSILKLYISAPGHEFSDSILELSMSPTNRRLKNIHFKSLNDIAKDNKPLVGSFSRLSLNPKANLDYVEISWQNKLKQATWFQIYRDDVLQTVLFDSTGGMISNYHDLTGIPNDTHQYRVRAYQKVNDSIRSKAITKKTLYPQVAPIKISNADIRPIADLGIVELMLTHESKNYDRIRVYRKLGNDTSLLAELEAADTVTFQDKTGKNGTSTGYWYSSVIKRFGNVYESALNGKTGVPFPTLKALPENPTATNVENGVTINWKAAHDNRFHFDGYLVVREDPAVGTFDTLGFVDKNYTLSYTDRSGIPNQAYEYHVFSHKKQQYSLSSGKKIRVNYPAVTPVTSLTASDGTFSGMVFIDIENQSTTHGGLALVLGTDTTWLSAGLKSYRYAFTAPYNTSAQTFYLANYREIDSKKYFSAFKSESGSVKALSGTTLPTPTQFTASSNYSNHIRLAWDYLVYVEPQFVIYRNDIALDTVSYDQRSYYDYTVRSGNQYTYHLQAILKGSFSEKAVAIGELGSNRTICGTVTTKVGGAGIVGAQIEASVELSNGIRRYKTISDSAGYYQLFNLPNIDTLVINVKATRLNSHFLRAQIDTVFGRNEKIDVSFLDIFNKLTATDDKIAQISYFQLTKNYETNTVELRWNVSSPNFSGFNLYRGGVKMATLKASDGKYYVDDAGRPDLWYIYTVEAFWDLPEGTLRSRTFTRDVQYPGVLPVADLTVQPYADLDLVKVQWSHANNKVSWYEVTRSGTLMAKVKPNQVFEFVDKSGLPEQTYLYAVKAVKQVGKRLYYSQPDSVEIAFPAIAPVKQLQADVNAVGNAVKLTWNHHSMNSVGYRIYRDYELIYDTMRVSKQDKILAPVNEFIDYGCKPGVRQTYQVSTYAYREDERYKSGIAKTIVTAAKVRPVANLDTTILRLQDRVILTWNYSDRAHSGFKLVISSGGNPVDSFSLAANARQFDHNNGIPEQQYSYSLKAFALRDIYAESNASRIAATFPKLAKPIKLKASDATLPYVALNWEHRSSSNDGFMVYRNNKPTYVLERGAQLSYNDLVENVDVDRYQEFEYALQAFKIIDKDTIKSDLSSLDMGSIINDFVHSSILNLPHSNATSFGYSVDISGDYAIVGAPGAKDLRGNSIGQVFLYHKDQNSSKWQLVHSQWNYHSNDDLFGFSVAIDGLNIVVGAPDSDRPNHQEAGRIWHFTIDTANNRLNRGVSYLAYHDPIHNHNYAYDHFGYDVDISGNKIVVGAPHSNFTTLPDNRGRVYFFQIDGNNRLQQKADLSGTRVGANLGSSVAIDGSNYLISAPSHGISDGGTVHNGKFTSSGQIRNSGEVRPLLSVGINDEWGFSVALNDDYYLIGNPLDDQGSLPDVGAIQFINSGNFNNSQYDYINTFRQADYYGHAVAISDYMALVGCRQNDKFSNRSGNAYAYRNSANGWKRSRELNNQYSTNNIFFGRSLALDAEQAIIGSAGSGFAIYNLVEPVTDLTSKTNSGSVSLKWKYHNTDFVDEYRILRDRVEIATTNGSTLQYDDQKAIPGKQYTYTVYAVNNDGQQSPASNVHGNSETDGKLTGYVYSAQSGDGLQGINISATATVEGEVYTYSTTSGPGGKYTIDDVYYADSATYTVKASYPLHVFIDDEHDVVLEQNQNTGNVAPFLDTTAFIIKGNVAHAGFDCGIDSAKVTMSIKLNGKTQKKEVYTNTKGEYSFNYDPLNPDLEQITVSVDHERTKKVRGKEVSTPLSFKKARFAFYNFSNPQLITTVNFEESTTYPIEIWIRNNCDSIPGNNEFLVNIRTEDDCINKTILTTKQELAQLNLPPKNYIISVMDVNLPTSANMPILSYLQPRPINYNLLDIHNQNLIDTLPIDSLDLTADIVYHKIPTIRVAGMPAKACNELPPIVAQGSTHELTFSVMESHNGQNCHVTEGFITVTNPSLGNSSTQVHYDDKLSAFPVYALQGGNPNMVSPHKHYLIVSYFTPDGRFQKRFIQPFIVTGETAVPGNDVVVDPNQDGRIKMPLFVLRDPPGDGSYSYIKEGTKLNRTITVNDNTSGSSKTEISGSANVFSVTAGGAVSISNSGSTGRGRGFNISTELNQTLQTSATNTGDSSGIMVGLGVAAQYGITQRVFIEDCKAETASDRGFTGSQIKSTWVYTLDQIHKLIGEAMVERKKATDEDKIAELDDLINNWEKMVEYYEVQTLPYVCLCDKNRYNQISAGYRKKIEEWSESFCDEIGTGYSTGNFKPFDKIEWTNSLIADYNKLNQISHDFLSGNESELAFKWDLVYSQSDDIGDVGFDQAYDEAFGPDIENITFSGGTSIEKSTIVSTSASRSWTQNYTFALDASLYFGFKEDVRIESGSPFFSVSKKVGEAETKVTQNLGFAYAIDRSSTNTADTTTTIGYVLTDNDPGDQYSVTVFRGIDKNHTPYFELFGGRTSCPTETQTAGEIPIARDRPHIMLEWPDETGADNRLYNLETDEIAIFPLKLSNLNTYGEERDYTLSISGLNRYNASLSANSTRLGEVTYSIPANGSVYVNLEVQRSPNYYQHADIAVSLSSACDGSVSVELPLEAHWKSLCSNISILNNPNWAITSAEVEALPIVISDYDYENPNLESIKLEYRRRGSDDWVLLFDIDQDSLRRYDISTRSDDADPVIYDFVWNIKNKPEILDGTYDLKATAYCGINGFMESNIVEGTINRSGLQLFGRPAPTDGFLSHGESVMATFNLPLDVSRFTQTGYAEIIDAEGQVITGISAVASQRQVLFNIPDNILKQHDGERVTAKIYNLYSESGNGLSDTVQWSFVVSYNALYWQPRKLVHRMYLDDKDTLVLALNNSHLTAQATFSLSIDKPTGLSLSTTSGQIQPMEQRLIKLYLDASQLRMDSVNKISLIATEPDYGDMPLPIEIHVYPKAPKWRVNPARFASSMNIVANFKFKNIQNQYGPISEDSLDLIAVEMDGEIRGVAHIDSFGDDDWCAYLTVYGHNTDFKKPLSFRVWDASEGVEYNATASKSHSFQRNGFVGSIAQPEILKIDANVDRVRYIPLVKGWNWLSINVSPNDNDLNAVLKSLSPASNDEIKTWGAFAKYVPSKGWVSSTGLNIMHPDSGYMLNLHQADTLRLTGKNAEPGLLTHPGGWNLIGFPHQQAYVLDSIWSSIPSAGFGDTIKSQTSTATFDTTAKEWQGSLQTLRPYQSYLVRLGEAKEIDLSSNKRETDNPEDWKVHHHNYAYNMTITGIVVLNQVESIDEQDKVAAFIDGECRGTGHLVYMEDLNRYMVGMMVYSNKPAAKEEVTFKIYDADQRTTYDAVDIIRFEDQKSLGSFTTPFKFRDQFGTGVEIPFIGTRSIIAFPNPFTHHLSLEFKDDKSRDYDVKVFNVNGQLIYQSPYQSQIGDNRVNLQLPDLHDGLYFIKATTTEFERTTKVLKE